MSDWKKSSDYPSESEAREASPDFWAWCFLLRNNEFKKELEEAKKKKATSVSEAGQPLAWSETPVGMVLKKWGVDHVVLPEWLEEGVSDSPVKFQKHPVYARLVTIEGRRFRLVPEVESRVVLEFDLSSPLGAQLDRAAKMLEASQKQVKQAFGNRKQVAMYPTYLRVLDAAAASITKPKMAEVFSLERPEGVSEKDIDNWIKAAKKLAQEGYVTLAKLS